MIISSLGIAVPSSLTTGTPATTDFNNLWSWDGTKANFPSTGVWSGWNGNPNDITVQRINLSTLLVNLWLSYNNAPNRNTLMCYYAIDYTSNPLTTVTNTTNYIHGYFLKNSVLALFYTNTSSVLVTDSFQILSRDSTFAFDLNKWVNSLGNPTNLNVAGSSGGSGGPGIGNFDFSDMVNGFLNAPGPTATPGNLTPSSQQSTVISNFVAYMTDYTNWASAGFPYPSTIYNTAVNDQATLVNNANSLLNNIVIH